MDSTDKNPLTFFEYIVNQKHLSSQIDNQLFYSDAKTHFINQDIINYVDENEFGELINHKITVKDLMIPLLYRKYQQAKNSLNSYCFQNSQIAVENYLRIQIRIIQNIIDSQSEFLNNNKFLMLPIRGLVNYINQVLSFPDMDNFELDESSLEQEVSKSEDSLFDTSQQSDSQIIHSIFDYMNGLNEKREQILNNDDFELLIKYTQELIDTKEVPKIQRQLEPKISNDLIRFSYWVLHKKIYTTKKLHSYFYKFIKDVFVSFDKNEINSIKSQFGTAGRVPKDSFIPKIISDYL